MKSKLIAALAGLWILMAFARADDNVFICDSGKVGKYHYSSSCRGLNACKYEVVKMSKGDARSQGYELCGWED
jgi:hypothetical protein